MINNLLMLINSEDKLSDNEVITKILYKISSDLIDKKILLTELRKLYSEIMKIKSFILRDIRDEFDSKLRFIKDFNSKCEFEFDKYCHIKKVLDIDECKKFSDAANTFLFEYIKELINDIKTKHQNLKFDMEKLEASKKEIIVSLDEIEDYYNIKNMKNFKKKYCFLKMVEKITKKKKTIKIFSFNDTYPFIRQKTYEYFQIMLKKSNEILSEEKNKILEGLNENYYFDIIECLDLEIKNLEEGNEAIN